MSERHPGEVALQQYAGGELAATAAVEVRAHLEQCPECRTEAEALERTWSQCALHCQDLLPGTFLAPPRPWADLRARMAATDRTPVRRFPWLGFDARAWALTAALLALAIGIFLRFRQTPPVEASELLRKAVAAANPVSKPRRIQVRTRTRQFLRASGHAGASTVKSLQAQFQAAHFDWDDPLTARAFVAWREQLADRRDEVIRERDAVTIRTDTSSGELMTATLTLRILDLRPFTERLEFRDRSWVELTDAGEEPPLQPDAGSTPAAPRAELKQEDAANAVEPAPRSSAAAATPGDELHVFAALHGIGADLGDPVEVSLNGAEVRVTGAGIPAPRQQELRRALSTVPNASLQLSDPGAAPPESRERVSPDNIVNADVSQLQARIAGQIGGREQFEKVAAEVLDLSETMMARAYALRRLAEHFPAGTEAGLGPADRRMLQGLRRDHVDAMQQAAVRMDAVLKPVLAPQPKDGAADAIPQAWQPATEQLFQMARQVDRLAAVLFGNTADEAAAKQAPAQLLPALTNLRKAMDAYERQARSEP